MRVARWSDTKRPSEVYFDVWHDESQFEAQRETPYRVVFTERGDLYCHGCQSERCLHIEAVRRS